MYISATNRGSERLEQDFYVTPIEVAIHFLHNHKIKQGNILEPCAGNGHIIKALRESGYDNPISAVEIRDEEYNLKQNRASSIYIENFLDFNPSCHYKTIISNPPYSIAQEIIEKCFQISQPDTEIIMLLRTAFLESKKRFDFWQKHPVNGLYVLSQRPSFTGKGTDATSYSWFIWNGSDNQEIKVI